MSGITAVPSGTQDKGTEKQAQVTQGESQSNDDEGEAANMPDTTRIPVQTMGPQVPEVQL